MNEKTRSDEKTVLLALRETVRHATSMKKSYVLLVLLIFAGSLGCPANGRLDPNDYEKICTSDSDCGVFTAQCINEDCQCPNFAAAITESETIEEDRNLLPCYEPQQGIECECAVVTAVCRDNRCILDGQEQ